MDHIYIKQVIDNSIINSKDIFQCRNLTLLAAKYLTKSSIDIESFISNSKTIISIFSESMEQLKPNIESRIALIKNFFNHLLIAIHDMMADIKMLIKYGDDFPLNVLTNIYLGTRSGKFNTMVMFHQRNKNAYMMMKDMMSTSDSKNELHQFLVSSLTRIKTIICNENNLISNMDRYLSRTLQLGNTLLEL